MVRKGFARAKAPKAFGAHHNLAEVRLLLRSAGR
jgi:hypothetical protein